MPSLFRRQRIERFFEALSRRVPLPRANRGRKFRPLVLEHLETRLVPTNVVGPGKFSGTISTNTEFDSTTGTYEINGALTIQNGVTLTVDPGVTVLIDPGVTVTDNGTLSIGSGAMIQVADTGGSMGITVSGGTLSASGATFSVQNGTDTSDAATLLVTGNGTISATGCEFAWDNVTLAPGTVLSTTGVSNVTNNAFDTVLTLPAPDLYLLGGSGEPSNKHFKQIDFAANDAALTGQSVTLGPLGSDGSPNPLYVFTGAFTVQTGSQLVVNDGIDVQIDAGATIADQGMMNIGSGSVIEAGDTGGATGINVDGGFLSATGATFSIENGTDSAHAAQLQVTDDGELYASANTFSWDKLALNSGATGEFSSNVVQAQLDINSGASVLASENDLSSSSATVVASGAMGTSINLDDNYWGTTTSSLIEAKITDSHANSALPTVTFASPLASAPSVTATRSLVTDEVVPFSATATPVTLSAEISSPGTTVNGGTVTFTVFDTSNNIVGQSVTSGTVSAGAASAAYSLPAGQPAGFYSILAVYSGTTDFQGSVSVFPDDAELSVQTAGTTTTAANVFETYSPNSQGVTLLAGVSSDGNKVNEGTVTFTVFGPGNVQVGQAVTSGTVTNGSASANFTLPAGEAPGSYTIDAVYNPGPDYQTSSDSTHMLSISAASTSTVASNASVPASSSSQSVTLSASVTSGGTGISQGTVTFTVFTLGDSQVGAAVTSGTVSDGNAQANFTVPAGQAAGSYTIQAVYNPGPDYVTSSDSTHTLSIGLTATTTVASNASATFSSLSQSVTLGATVTSDDTGISGGTVTFTVFNGSVEVGQAVTSGTVSDGAASASYTLPAGTALGSYTIQAVYNPGSSYSTSSDDTHQLTVSAASTTTLAADASAMFDLGSESVTLGATVTSAAGSVNQGTVTFAVFEGTTQIGTSVTSGTVSAGAASASYTLPAGTPVGTYTIDATYNPGADFTTSSDDTHLLTVTAGTEEPPVLPPVNGSNTITLPYYQFPYSGALNASSSGGNQLAYSATVSGESPLYNLESQYQFTGVGYFNEGAAAYVLHSDLVPSSGVAGYYLLSPAGNLYPYDGSGNYDNIQSGTPIASLGANVYTDPTLLLNAQPPANYTALQSAQAQYQFTGVGYITAGVPAYVLHSNQTGSGVGGYYLLSPAGNLYAYNGSGNYDNTQTGTPIAVLGATVYTYPAELIDAQASPTLYAQLYQVDSQLDLHEQGNSYDTNFFGNQAEWLYSPVLNQYGQHYYTLILSNGQTVVRAWEGYSDSSVGAIVATFDTAAVYDNPALLTNATYLPNPSASTASVSTSGQLTINLPSSGFVGSFQVVVTVSDAVGSSSQTVTVTSTDTAPTLSVTQDSATVTPGSTLSVTPGSFPLSDTTTASAAGSQDVTTTATVSSYSQLFSLEQQYRFQGVGYFNAGGLAYVFTAAGDNAFGNSYYLLSTTGGLYAYDGSGNYATSFARTPVATLSAEVYSDPTLLTNAQPPIDYSQYYALQQQYQFQGLGYFTAGATAYVFKSSQSGPGIDGYYLLTANGNLYAYDGSGNYSTSIANSANIVASLDPGVYVNPSLLLDARAAPGLYPQLQQTEQQLDLQELPGGFYVGLMGNAAKWLYSPVANSYGQHYYTLVLSTATDQALLFAWNGGSNSVPTGATPVATLDSSVYYNPALLLDAKAPEAATGVTVGVTPTGPASSPSTGTLAISAPDSFVGTFQVTVTATDGALTTTQTFQVASTDTPPVPAAISNQTASASGSPLAVTLSATAAEGATVTYTATVESAAYALQQQYQFTGVGLFTAGGVTAYVLNSDVPGGANGYYLLSSTGGVYAYDGSGSFASTIADSYNLVAQLTPAVYTTPTLLTAATAASPGATLTVTPVNATTSTLSVKVAGVTPGTVFEVFVTASDGAETTRTSFLVTVTA